MANKRKTRAQKIRAANRQTPKTVPAVKTGEATESSTASTHTPKETPTSATRTLQVRDLRTSLVLFFVLIALQVGLWIIFNTTEIDARIYDLIKL